MWRWPAGPTVEAGRVRSQACTSKADRWRLTEVQLAHRERVTHDQLAQAKERQKLDLADPECKDPTRMVVRINKLMARLKEIATQRAALEAEKKLSEAELVSGN